MLMLAIISLSILASCGAEEKTPMPELSSNENISPTPTPTPTTEEMEVSSGVSSSHSVTPSDEGEIISLSPGRTEFVIQQTVEAQIITRTVIIEAPPDLEEGRKYPVVLAFHGNGGTPQSMVPLLREYVNNDEIIAVYPEGYLKSWNLGPEKSPADEVEFVNLLMDELQEYPEMRGEKFALGVSNGAAVAHYLAVKTGYFEAIAALVSPLIVGNEPITETAGISVIQISGMKDELIPYEGGPSPVGHIFFGAEESSQIWANHNNCSDEPDTAEVSLNLRRVTYDQCDDGKRVHHYGIINGGHVIPEESIQFLIDTVIAFFIEEPSLNVPIGKNVIVAVEGVLGWSENGNWMSYAEIANPAEEGDLYQVSRVGDPTKVGVPGSSPEQTCTHNYANMMKIAIDDPWFDAGSMPYLMPEIYPIAISANWDLTPNTITALDRDSVEYRTIAEELLSSFDVSDTDVELTTLIQTDLDGDGVDEIFFGMERISNSLVSSITGDYSFLYMHKIVDGRVIDELIYGDINAEGFGILNGVRLFAIADLNGDGRMEVIVGLRYYEGSSTYVLEFNDDKESFTQVFSVFCGS